MISLLLLAPSFLVAASAAGEYRLEHVFVSYDGIDEPHARALARTVETARQVCVDSYGFDMPQTIRVEVAVRAAARVNLFNDGVDTFSLTLRPAQDLRRPAATGTFHLYGLCHEVAHLAMYRPIADRRWLTTAGAEGWAHYLGSHLVDAVYTREGKDLWPDRYEYRDDGTKRLNEQLAGKQPSDTVRAAKLWAELEALIGRANLARLFAAWGKGEIDPADPASSLRRQAVTIALDGPRLNRWLVQAEPVLFLKRARSELPLRQVTAGDLTCRPRELAHDDGKPANRQSIAGGGHAVRFQVPDDTWYLTSVHLFGSRYGQPAAPREDFSVWLCDDAFRPITEFKFPYSSFERGEAKWVSLRVKPTAVPQKFIICIGFNPSARKGVFVSHDAKGSGHSFSGLPGSPPRDFATGDWMIRIEVDRKGAPLKGE
jgi:hypothetical protein